MEELHTSEMSVYIQMLTDYYHPEDQSLNIYRLADPSFLPEVTEVSLLCFRFGSRMPEQNGGE
jgi:hypothetical protein